VGIPGANRRESCSPGVLNDIARKLQVSLSFQERYARASTNTIVREAGISKGLLFRHFGSKKDLYLAALDHCLEVQVGYFKERKAPLPA
jgi:AcrR family transcriptional regulator